MDRPASPTPVSLLQRLREPDAAPSWDRFVRLYAPLLHYWARRLGLQEPDAADLVQDVFLTLVVKLPEFTYDRHQSFRAWLCTVLHNKWRDRLRHLARRPRHDGLLPDLAAPDTRLDLEEAEYRRHLVRRALQIMQAEFQPTTWQACWRLVVEGERPAEVAAALGLGLDAVYTAKSRVLRRLRQELEGLLE